MNVMEMVKPHNEVDKIHAGEAYCVWTHATARYDTMVLTQYLLGLIHDKDFKALVDAGLNNVIRAQIKKLEDEAEKYTIPLPPKPPASINIPNNTDGIEDQAIFRIILDGAQSALLIHVKAINITTNDQLRKIYKDFLKQELDSYDILIKYGKSKSWIKNPPNYVQQVIKQ